MDERIPCEVIQDLLPLYVDGLTREITSREIEQHLAGCGRCRESYEGMKASIDTEKSMQREEARLEIDYLKTLKKRNIRHVALGIAAAVLVILAAAWVKLFVLGSPTESYMITYLDADEDEIRVGGAFFGSASVYSRHKMRRQPDGSYKLVVYSCLASPWNRRGVFNLVLDRKDGEQQVQINEAAVLKDGFVVGTLAGRLYKARNPYAGDASANGRLAGTLNMGQHMGGFKNELQTGKEPYGWTLRFEDGVRNSAVFDARMNDYGCVLLALTDNLGEVTWVYTAETEGGPVERSRTLTARQASDYLGASVKSFGESSRRVQELLDLLDLPE